MLSPERYIYIVFLQDYYARGGRIKARAGRWGEVQRNTVFGAW